LFVSSAFSTTLPSEYTPLEYIESDGRVKIVTGVIPNNSVLKIDYDFQFLSFNPSGGNVAIMGCGDDFGNVGGGVQVGVERLKGVEWFYNMEPGTNMNRFQEVTNDRLSGTWTINGSSSTNTLTGGLQDSVTSSAHFGNNKPWRKYPVTFFQSNQEQNTRLFQTKIYLDNVVVRNFVPVKRKSDNVVGLYDLVGDTFYTNSGTGDFIAGPEVCAATVTILGAQFCLTENQPSGSYLTARYNNNKYYINLSVENDALNPKTITSESNNVLRIKVGNTTYNAHDSSVSQ